MGPRRRQLSVAFCHPDLGLGGAERLVVDAAVELAACGHSVDVFTAHHDPQRCFAETVGGLFPVVVAGSWFPRHVLHRAHALCAYVRCLLIAAYIAWSSWRRGAQYDAIFVDQVSAVVPLLHLLTSAKVLFYCHYPDMLLASRQSQLQRLYRAPIDWLEELSTGAADQVVVNSDFTRGVFSETFGRLQRRGVVPGVLYPAVHAPSAAELQEAADSWGVELPAPLADFLRGPGPIFLSINRYERKKEIEMAVLALHEMGSRCARSGRRRVPPCRLVLAGGYDERLAENREYYSELRSLVDALGLGEQVFMVRSFSDRQRALLLAAATAVLYTPQREHFGIVPLEAMAAGRPVIACDSGGPRESVVDGRTGLLCEPSPAAFAHAMQALVAPEAALGMGQAAREHVLAKFSREAFGKQLEVILQAMVQRPRRI